MSLTEAEARRFAIDLFNGIKRAEKSEMDNWHQKMFALGHLRDEATGKV